MQSWMFWIIISWLALIKSDQEEDILRIFYGLSAIVFALIGIIDMI